MNFAPILNAPGLIQIHAAAALSALLLGLLQFAAPKGSLPHRTIGWTWIGIMTVMLSTAFINHDVLSWGPFSPNVCCRASVDCTRGSVTCASIHLLSVMTLLSLPYAVLHARLHHINLHRGSMFALLIVVMLLGTLFTLLPHRIMHDVVFG